jgi:phage gpG-like protein
VAGKVNWHGDKLIAAVTAHFGRNLAAAVIVLANHAKRLISVDGTAKVGKGKKSKLRYNANPSSPGEPPHVQTDRLRGSVAWEILGIVARVGTNLKYGRWLELGTSKMAARPWLRRALAEMRQAVIAILMRPMP